MRRNPGIAIRQEKKISAALAVAMCTEVLDNYFKLLDIISTENNLHEKPSNVYNADKTSLQLNIWAGNILAKKGSKSVPLISCGEKGKTIGIIRTNFWM